MIPHAVRAPTCDRSETDIRALRSTIPSVSKGSWCSPGMSSGLWLVRRAVTMGRMCGRYASIKAPADLADEFRAVDATEGVEPDYNVAPTKNIVAVVGPLRQVHDRMPLVLPVSAWDAWLDPDADAAADAVAALLAPPSAELVASLELRPVSPLVNSVRNNGPQLLDPDDNAAPLQLDLLA